MENVRKMSRRGVIQRAGDEGVESRLKNQPMAPRECQLTYNHSLVLAANFWNDASVINSSSSSCCCCYATYVHRPMIKARAIFRVQLVHHVHNQPKMRFLLYLLLTLLHYFTLVRRIDEIQLELASDKTRPPLSFHLPRKLQDQGSFLGCIRESSICASCSHANVTSGRQL